MNPNREDVLFAMALEKLAEKRAAFLDAMCEGDAALRQRLEALLAAHERSKGMLAEPTDAAKSTMKVEFTDASDETVGQKIGRYKILEKVGEGGCGVVYVAEQTEPVRRRVALKVIKLGMDTRQVVARFEAERQALAMMDHPNIAKVLDASSTEAGRPYFIMELVRGIRITEYCDQNKLSTNERLDLFIKICQAIQHAHQKGIIHRDIKPSNILVTLHDGVPVPKVIDFGIAKATTDQRLTDKTIYTQLQQFVGTPAYMSPEQAEMSGLDVDTRSDIYSLGVLLYELLTGKTPFDANELMSRGIDAMRKTIREKDPVRPSTKLATLKGEELTTTTKRRSVDRTKLLHQLKGDLDWIVMKCLEKDRTRRYETANGLAMDLKRHLNNDTVVARPPSKLYEFQKTVRRHKVGFAATAVIIVVLATGILMTSWQAVRATHAKASEALQREKAVANEQKAVAAQASEAELRRQAQAEELAARQRAYASDMSVAIQALEDNNLGRALDLLNRQTNAPGQKDLRGWEWRYLWGQTRSDAQFTLCQIDGEVNSLAVSPDGNWLAVGSVHKGGLTLWNLRTRQDSVHLNNNEAGICAAFSAAGSLLAFSGISADGRCMLHLWNIATRQMAAEFPLERACIGLAFSRDGLTLATSSNGGPIVLWKMPEGTKLARYTSQQDTLMPATGFAATPDLSLAAYGLRRGEIQVVDLRNGTDRWKAIAAKEYITALAFSPDGKTLASAAGFGESNIRLWDAVTGNEIGQLTGHGSWVSSIVFWPDGKKLASASADQTIRIWNLSTRECLDVLRGHRDEVWRLALLPDKQTLVSGSKDGAVCLWDTSRLHPRLERITFQDRFYNWRFTPNSEALVTVDRQGRVARWSGAGFQTTEPLTAGTQSAMTNVYSFDFSPDARLAAVAFVDDSVQIWDISAGRLAGQFTQQGGPANLDGFFAGGDRLVTRTRNDLMFHVWDLAAKPVAELQSWHGPARFYFNATTFSPDNVLFVALGVEGDTVIRELESEKSTYPDLGFLEPSGCDFSHNGRLFAMSSQLGYARVWNTATWKEVATLRGFQLGTHSVAFSPDDTRLATGAGSSADALKLWDVASWQQVLSLKAEGSIFVLAAFAPDGNTVAAMSSLGVLNLWRAPSWAEIHAAEARESKTQQP